MVSGVSEDDLEKLEMEKESKYGKHYKWIALSNTTLGALMAAMNGSILLIALPAIFRGLNINPLSAINFSLLLWLLLGYNIVTAVFTVTVGRLSDMFGRVRLYDLGFLIFTIGSVALYISSLYITGVNGALSLIVLRLLQGIGGAFLFANGTAILTDAFPHTMRGRAMGFNQIAAVGGGLLGLIVGGLLASIDWHLVFLINVPFGIIGTIWAYLKLHEIASMEKNQKFDISGNILFALGVLIILIGLTYSIVGYNGSPMGWGNPFVYGSIILGVLLLIPFAYIELKSKYPMFRLQLFKIRAFLAGNISLMLAGLARGGLQFMLIIWLDGIWLPLHGVHFIKTPFDAAIDLIPFVLGFMIFGPISGYLSDKYGARILSTAGMLIEFVGFLVLATLPADFSYVLFAVITFTLGMGQGLFAAPNTTAIMNSVPEYNRGSASGMRATFMNTSFIFSIAIFFSILILGMSINLSSAFYNNLTSVGIPANVALNVSHIPPTEALFSAFLGYNPMKILIPNSTLAALPNSTAAKVTGLSFFPHILSKPFMEGMKYVLYTGAGMALIAAIVSSLRGKRYIYGMDNK